MSTKSGSSEDDLANWEVVTGDGDEQIDEDGFESDSSIEVVSMEMDELESSSPHVSLPSGSPRGPVFVLRVPSRERDDLTTESEESDEGDTSVSRELRMVCHREGFNSQTVTDKKGTASSPGVEYSKASGGEDTISMNTSVSSYEDAQNLQLQSTNIETDVQVNPEPAVHFEPQKVVEQVELPPLPLENKEESPLDAENQVKLILPGIEKTVEDPGIEMAEKDHGSVKTVEDLGIEKTGKDLGSEMTVESLDSEKTVDVLGSDLEGLGSKKRVEGLSSEISEEDLGSEITVEDFSRDVIKDKDEIKVNKEVSNTESEMNRVPRPSDLEQGYDVQLQIPPVSEIDHGNPEHSQPGGIVEIQVDKKIHLDILDNKIELGHLQPSNKEPDEQQEVPPEPLEGADPGNLNDNSDDEVEVDHIEEAGHLEDADSDDGEVEVQLQGPHALQNDLIILQPQPQLLVQDDTETESANEMELEDDRIESDQSDLHTPDISNMSNVDIGDLILDNHQVLRGYVHQPNGQLNITLNYIVGLVLVVVVGIGIGHSIGSSLKSPEQIAVQQGRMSEISRLRQQISEWHASSAITTKQKRLLEVENEHLKHSYQTMREKANLMQNEITELRSEVTKLKYKAHSAVQTPMKTHGTESKHFEEKKNQLMNVINSLQQERADLITAVVATRYGQPPGSVEVKKPCVDGQKVPPLDNRIAQDQAVKESGEEGAWIKPKKLTTESLPNDKEPRRDIVDTLTKELDFMHGRADMWENLYLKEKAKNAEKACPPKDSDSTEDVLRCVGKLIQGYSVSDNFTKILQQNWEEWMNQSHSSFFAMMDVVSKFTAKVRQGMKTGGEETPENKPNTSDGHKHGSDKQDKWTDTMQDLFNKTKTSVSNVSKQIQDTWKQVKNLSTDFWKKHEPIVSSVKDEMSNKVEKMSQHLKNWLHRSKRRKHRRYHRYYKDDDDDDSYDEQETWQRHRHSSNFGSTKRRQYDSKFDTYGQQHRYGTGNRFHKNCRRGDSRKGDKFRRLRNTFKNLNAKHFNRMNCNDVKKMYGKFETIGQILCVENLGSYDSHWFVCQKKWWYNSVYDIKTPDSSCQEILADWQVITGSGRKGCLFNNHYHHRHGKRKHRCKRKTCHYKNAGYRQQSSSYHENYDQYWTQNEDYPDLQGEFAGTQDYHPDLKFGFEEFSLEEIFSNSSFWDFSGTWYDNFGPKVKEDSWYLQQMKHRQLQREKKESRDKGRKNSKWLFARAEDREFQRTLPDDWYSRRSKAD